MAAGKSERFRPRAIVQPGPGDELDAGDGSGVRSWGADSTSEVRLKVLTEPTRIQGSGFHIRLNPIVCIKTSRRRGAAGGSGRAAAEDGGHRGLLPQPLEVLGFCRLPRHLPVKSETGEAPLARQGSPAKSLMRFKERGCGRGEDG